MNETGLAASMAQLRQSTARYGGRAALSAVCRPWAPSYGHGALMDRARVDSDLVVVTIFVNPTQFDRKDDYEQYPSNWRQIATFAKRERWT